MKCSREPQTINESNWYYEYPTHILFVHEVRNDKGGYMKTDQFKIPWRKLDASRKRRGARSSKSAKR